MEIFIKNLLLLEMEVYEDFCLFLSFMFSKFFLVMVLQNSVKVMNELLKGFRVNVKRVFGEFSLDIFENYSKIQFFCSFYLVL